VRAYLIAQGVPPEQLHARGYGTDGSPQGDRRRVELRVRPGAP
jgi:outer membrane protein OmpA-like peptidoglycan-associated protein